MSKTKLKNILIIVLALMFLIISGLWFIPVAGSDPDGEILIFSEDKSFLRDIMPVMKNKGTGVNALMNEEEIPSLQKYKTFIIDGQIKSDLSKVLQGYAGDVVIINPDDGFNLPRDLTGRILIAGEAGGALKEDKNAVELYNLLTGEKIEPNGRQIHTKKGSTELCITPAPLIMTGSLSSDTLRETGAFAGIEGSSIYYMMPAIRLILSVVMLLSLLALAWIYASEHAEPLEFPEGIVDAKIKSTPLFFLSRFILIIVSAIVSLVVAVGLGFFDSLRNGGILFISYIIGASLTTRFFYHFGMLGIKGKPIDIKIPFTKENLIKTLTFTLAVVICAVSLGQAGFWAIEINTSKILMWAVVFALLTYGFISVMQDLYLLQKAVVRQGIVASLLLFPYIPLFLIAAVYIPLGEFYMTLSVLKLIIFTFISLLVSKIIRDRTGSVFYAALSGAFCLSFTVCCQSYI